MKTLIVLCTILSLVTLIHAVEINGYCYLSGPSNNAGIKICFYADSPGAISDSIYTSATGYYQIVLASGIYDIHYSYPNYTSTELPNVPCFASTTLPTVTLYLIGDIFGALERGTYIIGGNISVPTNNWLYIPPGTTLLFNGNYSFTINGLLYARGTERDSITFETNSGILSWGGLDFQGSTSDSSILEYSSIKGSNSSGISCYNSSPIIRHCLVINNQAGITPNGFCGGGIYCSRDC